MKHHYNSGIRFLAFIALFIIGFISYSQTVASYSFSQSVGSYTTLTGGTVLGTTTNDDQTFNAQAIGFTFVYNGVSYTQVSVAANGFIVFGASATDSYTALSSGGSNNVVAALNRDIQAQAGSELSIQTIGIAPNRTCVIQWLNYRKFGAAGDNYNFQIRLNETTNVVDVMYGSFTNNATTATPQVGLRGASAADFNNRTSTTSWAATTAGVANTATVTLTSAILPASGQTFSWTPPSGCSGAPLAGSTASTSNPVCSGVSFTLNLSGATVASGLTYQWQSSPDGITYTNIPGATTASYTTTQSAVTYYQAIVTCTNSGITATSAPLQVTMNPVTNCYCTSNATSTGDEEIFNVTLGTLNNTSTCATTGGAGSILNEYSDYTAVAAAPNLAQASSYPFSVQVGTCGGSYPNSTRIFIDYNQNGLFTDAGEAVYTSAAGTTGPHFETGNITIPLSALTGNTRMRVITVETGTPTSITPCGTYAWGETEDYIVNIIAATPCAGSPSPGNTQSTTSSVCSGTSITLSMSTPPFGLSGITYQWQSSPDGITYANIAGATSLTYTTAQSANTYYQVVVTCTNSALSTTATPVQVTMNPVTNCYCTSNATSTGDEEIFNVTLGTLNNTSTCATTGGAGSILNEYSDYTAVAAAPNLAQTAAYPFSVQVGTCGGSYPNSTRIFIDYNQNGLFTDAGEAVYTSAAGTTGPHFETGNITIPLSALTGNTRMRVITVETGTPTSITPCGTYTWGETEDYMINIVSLPPNPPTPVQDPATPACSTGTGLSVPGSPAAGDAWYWQTTATATSTANPVSGTYTVFLNGTYYVRTFNAANNIWSAGSDSVVVSNIPLAATPPAPTAAASPACLSTTISMSAPASGTAYFWQGTNSNGASNAQNASAPYTVNSSGTYYVAAYDSTTSCWSNTNNVAVTINTYIPAAPVASNDSVMVCQGSPSAMIAATANPGTGSVIARFGNALISTGTGSTTYTVTAGSLPAGATITGTQLQIFGATAQGGSYRSEIRVALSGATTLAPTQISTITSPGLITPDPVITIPNLPASGGAVTLSLTETFDDAGNDAIFDSIRIVINYSLPGSTLNWWSASVGGILQGTGSPLESIGTLLLPNSNTPGTYTFFVAANSGSCASSRVPVNVFVNPLPVRVLNDTAVCSGTPYVLNAQNAGATYLWNTSATTQTISTTTGGMYYVAITTAAGCSLNDTMNLVINSPPIVNLGSDVGFCAGDSIQLDAGNTGFTFMWNNASTNQTLTTSTGGNYFVTVTNPATTCFASDTIMVTVNALPVVNLGADTAICAGDSVMLNAGNPGATYSWSNSATGQTISVNTPATYFVFVSDPVTGCNNSDTISISQNALPLVNIGADTAICNGSTLTLNAGHPGSSYTWSNSSTAQTLGVTAAGNYSVQVIDPNGCKGNDSINVTLKAAPVVNLGSDIAQCAGNTFTLDAGNAGSAFLWNNLTTSQTLTASSSGTYYVAVTNSNACTVSDTVNVTINPLPVVNLGNDTVQCGGSLTLNAGNPGFNYLWYDSSTGQTLTVFATNTISVTVTNPVTGCANRDTIMVTFNQYPVVNLGSDTSQCLGTVTLNAGNPGSTYLWSTSATSQTISASASGTYYVSVNNGACVSSDTIMVAIHPLPLVGFPAVAPICLQGGAVLLNATPAGGIFTGSAALSGAMFNPAVAGAGSHPVVYTYTDANSCSNSFTQNINVNDCTGIEELAGLSGVNIYPNPTDGMFNITILNGNFEELNISITDIQGKEVYNFRDKNVSGDYNKQISLEGLAKGIYYVKINAGSEVSVKKLIIN